MIKFLSISSQKLWKKLKVLNCLPDHIRTNHQLPIKPYMVIRILIFDFLRIEHLTQVGNFSSSVDSGATVNHYNDLKLWFLVMNLIVEFNVHCKSDFGIKIGRFWVKIQQLSHQKTSKIATSRKKRKKIIFNICILFDWFLLILVDNDFKWNFQ
jgi:hypothetical protein